MMHFAIAFLYRRCLILSILMPHKVLTIVNPSCLVLMWIIAHINSNVFSSHGPKFIEIFVQSADLVSLGGG